MKRSFVLPLLLALTACGSGAEETLPAAQASFARQDYIAARTALTAVLKDDPGNRAALELLVQVHLRQQDADAAESALDRLRRAGGDEAAMTLWQAEVMLLKGRADEALAMLGSAAGPEASRIRAAALIAANDRAGAGAAFRQGLTAGWNVRLASAYLNFLLDAGDPAAARGLLAEMNRKEPEALETLLDAGRLALAGGDTATAARSYATAGQAYPHRVEPLCGLAAQLDADGKPDEAMAALDRAEKILPGQRCVNAMRLTLWAVRGEWEKVRSALQPVEADLDPRSPEAMTYGEALIRLGKPEQARALFNRSLLAMPQNPFARLMLAEAQLATGDAEAAFATIRPLAESTLAGTRELELAERAARAAGQPEADVLRARLGSADLKQRQAMATQGMAALMRSDWNAAIAAYQPLLAAGEDGEVLKRLAWAATNAGRHDEAIDYADRALKIMPASADALHLAGLARINAGRDVGRGRELVNQAVAAEPENPRFRRSLELATAAAR